MSHFCYGIDYVTKEKEISRKTQANTILLNILNSFNLIIFKRFKGALMHI